MKTKACHCCQGSGVEIDNATLGAELRKDRFETKMSLRRVARRMKISAAYLSDLERGNRRWNNDLMLLFRKALTR